ncbi:hypothetical protein PG997_008101 [Apiospora hydei]|uniref:Heterokaryon incompatibility domain-containing protein n=1 Tax=Apiospora hydei TaxID=1337664 RepID=A0ABR1WDU2_9PEZI
MMNDKDRTLSRAERSRVQRYSEVDLEEILKLDSSSIQNPIIDCELFEIEFNDKYKPHGVPDISGVPGQPDIPSFTPFHLQKKEVHYEALSWCWGLEDADYAIRIRRGEEKYKLRAKKELVLALKYLRQDKTDRYLWIDAVCINQANPTERNHQVQIMAMIYSRATRVCVWLGDDDDDSAMAIKFISQEIMRLERFDDICKNKANADKWQALLALMQRPWFGRRWVVQEIALALDARVYCGPDEIPWKDFAVAVELFVEVETATHRLSEVIQKDERFYHVPGWFEYVSHLGASLLVGATAKVFRATEIHKSDTKDQETLRQDGDSRPQTMAARSTGLTDISSPVVAVDDTPATTSETSHHVMHGDNTSQGRGNIDNGTNQDQSIQVHQQLNNRSVPAAADEDEEIKSESGAEGVSVDPRGRRGLLSLEYLVSTLSTFEATEPRDAIYALLAIAKDTSPSAEVNDYHGDKSKDALLLSTLSNFLEKKPYRVDYTLPYSDVCKDFFSFCIERSQAADPSRFLDILCRPWALKPTKLDESQSLSQSSRKMNKSLPDASLSKQRKRPKGIFVDGKPVSLLLPRSDSRFWIRKPKVKEQEAGEMSDRTDQSKWMVDRRTLAEYRKQVLCKEEAVQKEIWKYFPSALSKSHRKDINLPSWVATVDSAPFGLFQHPDSDRNYSAAQKQKPEDKTYDLEFKRRPVLGHYSFYVKGFVLDEVAEVTAPAYGGNIPKVWTDVGGWADVKEDPPDAFLRTLVADRGKGNRNPPHYYSKACRESISKGSIESGRVNTEALINSEQNSIITEFCRRVQEVIWNRRLIKTKRGILGLAPEKVESGDFVCIIYGCSVPVILRRHFKGDVILEDTKELQAQHPTSPNATDTERWNHCTAQEAKDAEADALELVRENKDDIKALLRNTSSQQLTKSQDVRERNLQIQLLCEEKEDNVERMKRFVRKYEERQIRKARYRELCNNGFKYAKISMMGEEYQKYVEDTTRLVNKHLGVLKTIAENRQKAEEEAKEELAKLAKDLLKVAPVKEDLVVEEYDDRHYFYHVMGESYIHGMMDGEAIREKFVRKLAQHKFELR